MNETTNKVRMAYIGGTFRPDFSPPVTMNTSRNDDSDYVCYTLI